MAYTSPAISLGFCLVLLQIGQFGIFLALTARNQNVGVIMAYLHFPLSLHPSRPKTQSVKAVAKPSLKKPSRLVAMRDCLDTTTTVCSLACNYIKLQAYAKKTGEHNWPD